MRTGRNMAGSESGLHMVRKQHWVLWTDRDGLEAVASRPWVTTAAGRGLVRGGLVSGELNERRAIQGTDSKSIQPFPIFICLLGEVLVHNVVNSMKRIPDHSGDIWRVFIGTVP